MSRPFSHCRVSRQRLQEVGVNEPASSGSQQRAPRALRPERLQWLSKPEASISGPAKRKLTAQIAAFFSLALCQTIKTSQFFRTYWRKARRGHTPPLFLRTLMPP
jgi:hypothetical protein